MSTRDPDAEKHFNHALELSKKDQEGALASFRKAIALSPDYAEAYYNAGVVLGNLGRPEEAAEAFRNVIRIKPELSEGYFNLGTLYGVMGRKQEAVEMLKRAISLRPDYPEAHFNLGITYISLKNQAAALEEYKILSDLDRKRAERLFGLIYA